MVVANLHCLKALSRLLSIKEGAIHLDGKSIHAQSTKEIAKKIAILPQSPEVADGLTVGELASYGRFPHQKGFGRLTAEDKKKLIGHYQLLVLVNSVIVQSMI